MGHALRPRAEQRRIRICVVTGSRAEYGRLRPFLDALKDDPEVELQLLVTGMHLVPRLGSTVNDIERDGYPIAARVPLESSGDDLRGMARLAGDGVQALAGAFEALEPTAVLVAGDRVEAFAAATAATILGIPVLHQGGGQVSGGLDDAFRRAISVLATLHFPRSPQHADNLRRMGEEDWRIHLIGDPMLDILLRRPPTAPQEVAKRYRLDPARPLFVAVFHPDTRAVDASLSHAKNLFQALARLPAQAVVVYPNNDAGGRRLADLAERECAGLEFRLCKSLPQADFLGLLGIATALVGNSSSGFTEAAHFGTPVVNIGARQTGRDGPLNVRTVSGENQREITALLQRLMSDEAYRNQQRTRQEFFGSGTAGQALVRAVKRAWRDGTLVSKSQPADAAEAEATSISTPGRGGT